MIAVLRWILACALSVAVIAFSLANRGQIGMIWSPVHAPISLPLFLPVLIGVITGFLSGGFMVWLNGAAARRERRKQKRTIHDLEKQVEAMVEKKIDTTEKIA